MKLEEVNYQNNYSIIFFHNIVPIRKDRHNPRNENKKINIL